MKCKSLLQTMGFTFLGLANASQQFDFVIIGGGNCGLTVANRLSELPSISVAVVEAGSDERHNPDVTRVGGIEDIPLGTAVDWNYTSTSQTHVGNRTLEYHSGKALGGSTAINGMTYIRSEDAQIDVWEKIGNKGWNWKNLFPYYKSSERFQIPTPSQTANAGATYVEDYHGFTGPLDVGYQFGLDNGSYHDLANITWQKLGIPFNEDVNSGHIRGFCVWPRTVDREANVREDAARAYYHPVENRPNLKVFKGTVTKIIWENRAEFGSGSIAIAQGIEFVAPDGAINVVRASKEVIVSAGALRSPAILELSGVGNPAILEKHNVSIKVPLATVGENLQDQPINSIIYKSKDLLINGLAPYVTFAIASDFLTNPVDDSVWTRSKLKEWSRVVSDASGNAVNPEALEYLFEIQHDLIFREEVPIFEVLTSGSGDQLSSSFWFLLPFSRGSVHIGSADPLQYPLINPSYLLADWDLTPQVDMAKTIRSFWSTEPISRYVASEITPGFSKVPEDATDKQWGDWIKSTLNTNYHPVGTLSMMPKELGGVVDDKLIVYGTKNVRVIDASVLSYQVSGHPSSTLYAVAERAADIIKASL